MSSIAELLATGEAWNEPASLSAVPALHRGWHDAALAEPEVPPAPVPPFTAPQTPPGRIPAAQPPAAPTLPATAASGPPAEVSYADLPLDALPHEQLSGPARSELDALVPLALPSVVAVPVQAGPRVQLGFRDGTTASLDPDSEQALALAELSELLNARD